MRANAKDAPNILPEMPAERRAAVMQRRSVSEAGSPPLPDAELPSLRYIGERAEQGWYREFDSSLFWGGSFCFLSLQQ
ncbi:hypothetical protein D9M72_642860 [compost metagenome]